MSSLFWNTKEVWIKSCAWLDSSKNNNPLSRRMFFYVLNGARLQQRDVCSGNTFPRDAWEMKASRLKLVVFMGSKDAALNMPVELWPRTSCVSIVFFPLPAVGFGWGWAHPHVDTDNSLEQDALTSQDVRYMPGTMLWCFGSADAFATLS